jgi:glycosyltransferase involved in cell wall biosynthesis
VKLLMVSGDRQVTVEERGPFHAMQREFSRYFERVDVICPRPPKKPTLFTIHDNVHFHPASCGRLGMPRYIERKGGELIAAHGHALITSHDYGWFYNGVGSAKLSRKSDVPYLSELHHVPGYPVPADLRERFDKLVAKRYVRWAIPRTLGFRVVNSTEMPALLREWRVPEHQIFVLPSLYIDLEVFRPSGVPQEHDQDVVCVGRMVSNKGLDRVVDALAMLRRRGAPHRALFVGKGPKAKKVREQAIKAGLGDAVRFVDWVASPHELAEIYRRSRTLVCASTCEGGPRVTVEAMACGTPVVSTRVGVMPELLADGAGGRLCDFTARSLADTLQGLLTDEDRRLAMGAHALQVAQNFESARAIGVYAQGLIQIAQWARQGTT